MAPPSSAHRKKNTTPVPRSQNLSVTASHFSITQKKNNLTIEASSSTINIKLPSSKSNKQAHATAIKNHNNRATASKVTGAKMPKRQLVSNKGQSIATKKKVVTKKEVTTYQAKEVSCNCKQKKKGMCTETVMHKNQILSERQTWAAKYYETPCTSHAFKLNQVTIDDQGVYPLATSLWK